jgi:hypothetical protein
MYVQVLMLHQPVVNLLNEFSADDERNGKGELNHKKELWHPTACRGSLRLQQEGCSQKLNRRHPDYIRRAKTAIAS